MMPTTIQPRTFQDVANALTLPELRTIMPDARDFLEEVTKRDSLNLALSTARACVDISPEKEKWRATMHGVDPANADRAEGAIFRLGVINVLGMIRDYAAKLTASGASGEPLDATAFKPIGTARFLLREDGPAQRFCRKAGLLDTSAPR